MAEPTEHAEEEVTFFAGLKFVEPCDDQARFDQKVQRVFSDSFSRWLKRASFCLLLGRIALNSYMNLRPIMGRGHITEDHVDRIRMGFCNTLTNNSARETCAADLRAVTSKWNVDIGMQYTVSAKIVYSSERLLFCLNAAGCVCCLLVASFQVYKFPSNRQHYGVFLLARKLAIRIAGMSALKAMLFLSVPTLSLFWSTEWLQGIRALFADPEDNTGVKIKPIARRMRSAQVLTAMAVGILSALFSFTAFQVKLLEHQHLLFKRQSLWTWYDWYQFLNLVNIVMSIFEIDSICSSRMLLFAFGGKDGTIDVAEWEKKQTYLALVLQSAKKQFATWEFIIIAFQHNSGDLQKIMLVDDYADDEQGTTSKLVENVKEKPMRIAFLGLFTAALVGAFFFRKYADITVV